MAYLVALFYENLNPQSRVGILGSRISALLGNGRLANAFSLSGTFLVDFGTTGFRPTLGNGRIQMARLNLFARQTGPYCLRKRTGYTADKNCTA